MTSTLRLLTIFSAALTLLAACGESEEDQAAKERYRKALASYKSELKQWKEDQVEYDECATAMDDFRSELKELEGRLNVGLSFDEYSTKVGDASASYNQSDFEGGGADCLLEVGLPLETALNQYRKANNKWNDCFSDLYCELDSIDPELQAHWNKASAQIERSDNALDDLQVGPRPTPPPKPKALRDQ
jgi:hypothetical protein